MFFDRHLFIDHLKQEEFSLFFGTPFEDQLIESTSLIIKRIRVQ